MPTYIPPLKMAKGSKALYETQLNGSLPAQRGKVRDIYAAGSSQLLIVATDRISVFDAVLPTPVDLKGEVLTRMSEFWFNFLGAAVINHLISTDPRDYPDEFRGYESILQGRSMLVKKVETIPVECIVRGYLTGTGLKDYNRAGEVCGHRLPGGLGEASQLTPAIFTPSTKAETGHDVNISRAQLADLVGEETAGDLELLSLGIYESARAYAATRGIIIADTKFEFGRTKDGQIILIDEVLTPDSSRFWPLDRYQPGQVQPSFDKQFVRDYVEQQGWDHDNKKSAPELPPDIVRATTERYLEAYRLLTGRQLV